MLSKAFLIALAIAYVEARFGQEQVPVAAIQALGDFGEPGAAATLSGQVPGVLLAGASACDKLSLADDIVAQLGTDPQVIAAAQALVGAEQNFNPFADATGRICNDAALPATAELRGIVPLFDPDVNGSDVQNANAADTLANPVAADGLSVAELSVQLGFTNFNEQDAAGTVTATAVDPGAAGAAAAADVSDAGADDAAAAAEADAADAAAAADDNEEAAADEAVAADGVVFGNCDLSIARLPGTEFANRGANEADLFFFQSNDAGIAANQGEALNANIITNRVCDEIVNSCGGNEAGRAACDVVAADVDAQLDDNNDPNFADLFNDGLAQAGAI